MAQTTPKHKVHLYEVDFMRLFFIFGVLINHSVNVFTDHMSSTSGLPYYLVDSIRMIPHYTRMGFLFMSGLVLMLNYYNKEPHWGAFLKKRFKGSIPPYLIWNFLMMVVIMWANNDTFQFSKFSLSYLNYVVHGSHFYLYFMIIIMQLYLLFPGLVWLFKRLEGHHGTLLAVSFVIQLAMMFVIKYKLEQMDLTNWPYWFKTFGINVFVYQFYFIAGGYTAIHYNDVYDWINAHIKPLAITAVVMGLGTTVYFRFWDEAVLHLGQSSSDDTQQPYLFIYDVIMIMVVFWIGKQYAAWRQNGMPSWLDGLIQRSAKVNFGIYLNQIIGLITLRLILDHLQLGDWTLVVAIPLGSLFVLSYSFLIAWFCYKVYPFGFLIGRPQKHRLKARHAKGIGHATSLRVRE